MKKDLLFIYFCVFVASHVLGDNTDVTKGAYPFMAFLYYQDPEIIEYAGNRFFRSAVIIRSSWLVSAAIDPEATDDRILGFPDKTLLARAGAIFIDSQITLNEDDNEQEREVVQLIRPSNHSRAVFWQSDITLLKTVQPFKIVSLEVGPAPPLHQRHMPYNQKCFVLMYVKDNPTTSQARLLFQWHVETVQSKDCGDKFYKPTMICAKDSTDAKSQSYCEGNSGGPLICNDEVIGLQTYVDNDCSSPHKYQLLSKWESFINCGIENKCHDESCACIVTDKDEAKDFQTDTVSPEASNEIQMRVSEKSIAETVNSSQVTAIDDEDITYLTTSNEIQMRVSEKSIAETVKSSQVTAIDDEDITYLTTTTQTVSVSILAATDKTQVIEEEQSTRLTNVNETPTLLPADVATQSTESVLTKIQRKSWISNILEDVDSSTIGKISDKIKANDNTKVRADITKTKKHVKRNNSSELRHVCELLMLMFIFVFVV